MIQGAKPWQMVVIVVGIVLGSALLVYQCVVAGDKSQFATQINLVDVVTGDLIRSDKPKNKSMIFPVLNPATKTATLFPAQQEDGKWMVVPRYMAQARDALKNNKATVAVGLQTGQVKVANESPKRLDVF